MASPFDTVQGFKPGKTPFNLSYTKLFTGDLGPLYIVMCDEMVPGDIFSIANNAVVRFNPLVAPILHEISIYAHYYFVPYRILWDDWEDFITGGADGADTTTMLTWNPSDVTAGSLWDQIGFPAGVTPDADNRPVVFPLYAFNKIYNDYYRDENLITEVALTDENIKYRAWMKDYFTSALPWQQRGTAGALPVSGTTSADWSGAQSVSIAVGGSSITTNSTGQLNPTSNQITASGTNSGGPISLTGSLAEAALDNNVVDLSSATSFDVTDLRLAIQLQKWQERNARGGVRYNEFIKSQYGENIGDARLQRPEFIGGTRQPVVVSEVLQNSETGTTPQGTMAGHGISVASQRVGRYRAKEFGLVMGIMSVLPRSSYSQGINRQWSRYTRYDYFNPLFAGLSEQEILRKELYANGTKTDNETIFGFQGMYDEMRYKPNMYSGEMRYGESYDHWNLGRYFSSAPSLNQTFIETASVRKDYLAAPSEPAMLIHWANILKAARPIPAIATPGVGRI